MGMRGLQGDQRVKGGGRPGGRGRVPGMRAAEVRTTTVQ
ncbi:hypothetical protein SMD44_01145 [Streptomyces alboflavus]|uniref:Uncharacterized protein n=1 Tax=Streptomyces alboflavus TaxID=67267 RepID=A0A1Z1W5R5_9ACTN|nr:hypothetical protein SMD44_01145 [Streptomyces alboflavus]